MGRITLTGTHPGHTPNDRRTHIELRHDEPEPEQEAATEPDEISEQEPAVDDAQPAPEPDQGLPQA